MGRPINKTAQSECTFRIFGFEGERGYLDKYPIEDETMVPIKHTTAPSTMTVRASASTPSFSRWRRQRGSDIEGLSSVLVHCLMRLVAEMGLLALYRHACVPDRGLTRPPPSSGRLTAAPIGVASTTCRASPHHKRSAWFVSASSAPYRGRSLPGPHRPHR